MTMFHLILILFALSLSFIFSGSEMGLYSVNRLRLRARAAMGLRNALNLRMLTARPQRAINTILTGNNLAHYLATAACATILINTGFGRRADLYSTLILAPLLVIFTEIAPKTIFLKRADILMYNIAPGLRLLQFALTPLLLLLDAVNAFIRSVSGNRESGLKYHFTREKLRSFLHTGARDGLVSDYQHRMANNVLKVKETTLRQAFIPLEEVVMAPAEASCDDIRHIMSRCPYSRLPLYSGSRENITGFINLIDMLEVETDEDLRGAVRTPAYVSVHDSIAHALYVLQKSSRQMAVAIGSEEGAAGICTVKDLVEEIVGDIYEW